MSVRTISFETTKQGLRNAITSLEAELSRREKSAAAVFGPCGCQRCDDNVQPGHFACSLSRNEALQAEKRGEIVREFDGDVWRWEWAVETTGKGDAMNAYEEYAAAILERRQAI